MNSNRNYLVHASQHNAARKFKRSSSFILGQLIVALVGMPLATPVAMGSGSTVPTWSTLPSNSNPTASNCTGSNPCYDIYQGTLSAMQAAAPNAQPSNLQGSWVALFYPTAFTGGLMVSGPMNYNLANTPSNSSQTTLTSWTAIACPSSGGAVGSYELEYNVSNELEITSDTSVENSSSTSMGGTAEIAIEYTSPALTGGVDPSASLAIDYGVEYESTTSTGFGTANSSGTESTLSQTIEYDVPEGYAQTFYLVSTTSTYGGVPWSAPIYLGGTLGTVTYTQMAKSTGPQPSATQQVNYNGTTVNANIWIPPQIWTAVPLGQSGGLGSLASPNGTYMYTPTGYAYLGGYYLESIGNEPTIYWEGGWYGTGDEGMQLKLDSSCDSGAGCSGSFWATNYAGTQTAWDSNTSPQYLAMQDDGNLVGYSSNWDVLWSSKAGKGVLNPPQANATPTPTPSQVLPPNAFAFTSSGTYNSTTYTSNAWVTYGDQVPLTQDQINTCNSATATSNSTTSTTSLNAPKSTTLASGPEAEAGYVLMKTSAGTAPMILAQNDDRRRDDRRMNDGQRHEVLRQDFEQQQRVNPNAVGATPVDPAAAVRKAKDDKKVTKLKKLKSPMVLKPSQYYVTNLAGFKVNKLTVRSNNLNNKFLTVAGPSIVDEAPLKTREIKWNPGLHKKFSVKGRSNI